MQRHALTPTESLFEKGFRSLSTLHARFHLVGGVGSTGVDSDAENDGEGGAAGESFSTAILIRESSTLTCFWCHRFQDHLRVFELRVEGA